MSRGRKTGSGEAPARRVRARLTRVVNNLLLICVLGVALTAAAAAGSANDKTAASPAASARAAAGERAGASVQSSSAGSAASAPRQASITEQLDCSECHSAQGWRVFAGERTAGGFDHSQTGFPLSGRHHDASCQACHRGERRLTRECSGCHADPHGRRLGQACDSCHSAQSWSAVSVLAIHRSTRLPLTGMHVLAACTECHQRTNEHQWRGVPADCFACHADDYRRPDIHPLHTGVPGDPTQPPLPRDCALCHRASGFSPAFPPASFVFRPVPQALRATSHDLRFPISFGSHRNTACGDCHVVESAPRLVRCTGCHAHSPPRLARQHARVGRIGAECLHCHAGGSRR